MIEKIKLNIIKEKNNAIFFNKNVVKEFEQLTEELKVETDNAGFLIETNILRNDNPEKRALLKLTIDEFGKGFILPFKQMVREYLETNNELILNEAINFYITDMVPKLKEIQNLKYDISLVEFDFERNIYKLIQTPNSLENKEFFWKDEDKVVNFVRGVKKDKKKTKKQDIKIIPAEIKNKTRKIKPIDDLVIEEEEDVDDFHQHEISTKKADIMKKHMVDLKEPYRTVIEMREIKRMPYQDIADKLGRNLSTIKSQIRNGRHILISKTAKEFTDIDDLYI
jgi:hypothetical protein